MRHFHCLVFGFIACCASLPLWALEINQATEAELDNLRGLGPAFTRRILAERGLGPFRSWSDLMQRVSGMGPATASKLSAQGLKVDGQVYPAKRTD